MKFDVLVILSNDSFLSCMKFSRYNSYPERHYYNNLSYGLESDLSSVSLFLSDTLIFLFPMGLSGLEPPTSRLSGVRSNHLSYKPIPAGRFHDPLFICGHILCPRGEYEIRTRDLLLARQALSQLS